MNSDDIYNAPYEETTPLTWTHVARAYSFVIVNVLLSQLFQLKLSYSLIVSSIRCMVQLTVMGLLLRLIFDANSPWIVALMTIAFLILGAYETVYQQSRRRYTGMVTSRTLTNLLGMMFALKYKPFWNPPEFIPTLGTVLGNSIPGMAIALNHCIQHFTENKCRVELYLSLGATRWEAANPIVVEAIRLGFLPTINALSVMGLISIPGLMTGQILSGVPVNYAVKFQIIMMFMIAAGTCLGILFVVLVSIAHKMYCSPLVTEEHSLPIALHKCLP
ncbi:UPF0014-domain-containing protein [Basidiobolus meristosporus CBS 931.73]|uniref:UPF0014-domain-containing protein n=1 Tax=Basidiobolus meristosporus CBS 931.73 TaxID=1314790 RepID=A0A1Y1YEL7_9FUNG|nr:UPF0014-domain-containing protein [Basidiobolus meristosporus CBS 931.73]|eukprot:ORX96395.1 UPF0014-domain-containing protein [Basidiobolus meristosporus CBS 931.73]